MRPEVCSGRVTWDFARDREVAIYKLRNRRKGERCAPVWWIHPRTKDRLYDEVVGVIRTMAEEHREVAFGNLKSEITCSHGVGEFLKG